jgi:glyoxylase I family protein
LATDHNKTAPGFHHIALRVADFEATLRLYQEGFGFVRAYGWGEGDSRAALLDTGDGNYLEVFAGGKAASGEDAPGEDAPENVLLHFALRTADVDGDYARALAAGSKSHIAPKEVLIQGTPPVLVRLAFVRGLDGEIIEFFQNDAL